MDVCVIGREEDGDEGEKGAKASEQVASVEEQLALELSGDVGAVWVATAKVMDGGSVGKSHALVENEGGKDRFEDEEEVGRSEEEDDEVGDIETGEEG